MLYISYKSFIVMGSIKKTGARKVTRKKLYVIHAMSQKSGEGMMNK
jgi:hypothetical protein